MLVQTSTPRLATTWLGFIAMCIGMFMAILDVQVVATSIAAIQKSVAIEPDLMSWLQTAYLIAEVIAIPLTGYLTRLLTGRWLFVFATTLFCVASIGCAASNSFEPLVLWRVMQGFAGGTLIPSVFAAVFVLFPAGSQGRATTVAGLLAVLAPTVGPIVGGWITETFSWHWLFLINVAPGILAGIVALLCLPKERPNPAARGTLDWLSLLMLAIALASLQIGLKQAPDQGWASSPVIGLLAVTAACVYGFAQRTLASSAPIVDLQTLGDRQFLVGCILSFVLGIGLFGSVYLMPVFLGFVRGQNALEIGSIMLVTGLAQLASAPIAVYLEQRLDPRLLIGAGFAIFALGLGLSAFQTVSTDAAQMVLPQILRGFAIMFCLLPPTRLALGRLPVEKVPDASGLFNLMRNLGGAIGLAIIDSIIYGRSEIHSQYIIEKLMAGDAATATMIGIPTKLFTAGQSVSFDQTTQALVAPFVQKAAITMSINEAWTFAAILTVLVLALLPLAHGTKAISNR
ncbi:DHA2 family multidrug resistance protein [Devosia sp. UYZn731]|uniref:DHA2 family efflux MFS transporter permease subunit n=1 Tax=Devosia sp. UYZn731 TaxID=3156345 RepID=UPI003393A23C